MRNLSKTIKHRKGICEYLSIDRVWKFMHRDLLTKLSKSLELDL